MPKNYDIDVRKNIQLGKYKNNAVYPDRPKPSPILGKVASQLTADEIKSIPSLKEDFKNAEIAYKEGKQAWHNEEGRMNALFEADCAAAEGMENHPKRQRLWSKAWDEGHANGYNTILERYESFAEFLRD